MDPPAQTDRRLLTAVAAGAALLVVLAGVAFVSAHRAPSAHGDTPVAHGALQVRMGETGVGKVDASAPLRCFVGGRFAGEMPLGDCAVRNGVESGKLGVGVDATGQVAAAAGDGADLAPLPEAPAADAGAEPDASRADAAPAAACLRYGPGGWRPAGVGLTLRACARTLFENRCVRPGEAVFGRYGGRTLRLTPGRVDVSPDNRDFDRLMDQDPDSCSLDG